jgi:pantetheine-phosphate adenylyltransferase
VTSALYAGSFDPIHLGHLSVIERSAAMFDAVVVAVLDNPGKRAGLFATEERVGLVRGSTAHLVNVAAIAHEGLTVDAVTASGVDGIIRTGHKDHDDEWSMLALNELMSGCTTFFVPPDPAVRHLSSSLVRSLIANDRARDATALVPPAVAVALHERLMATIKDGTQ